MAVAEAERPRRAFAWGSRAALTVIGVKPVDAGLKNADAEPATACVTTSCQSRAFPEINSAAITPWLTKRAASAVSITTRRGSRSAKTPPTRRKTISGIVRAAKT